MSTPTRQRWTALIREWNVSGQTLDDFATTRRISLNQLKQWNWRLQREQRAEKNTLKPLAPAFVAISAPALQPPSGLVIRFERWLCSVDVDAHTDLTLLRRVVEALT